MYVSYVIQTVDSSGSVLRKHLTSERRKAEIISAQAIQQEATLNALRRMSRS